MPLGKYVDGTCSRCGGAVKINLEKIKDSDCPRCDKGKKKLAEPKPAKKKKTSNVRSKEFRYPENKDLKPGEYPLETFLDFHCRSVNRYHQSPHLRVRDKGAAYRALEKESFGSVRRVEQRVKLTLVSHRQLLVDEENLAAGSAKGLVDILVRLGWIKDDTKQWLERDYDQKQVLAKDMEKGAERGTYIKIELV
ncbi:hypothetical protein LCGC14_0165340 [marine sediment metagenome]|uniref:Uncharacterized protein n=1 Tax=marine sediment metagenome TaxID=412755 RepID=A0A0F9UV27_9ZZZZ